MACGSSGDERARGASASDAEDGHRAVDFLRILVEIRVVLRTIVVEAEELAQARNGDGLSGLGEDGEGILRHVILSKNGLAL